MRVGVDVCVGVELSVPCSASAKRFVALHRVAVHVCVGVELSVPCSASAKRFIPLQRVALEFAVELAAIALEFALVALQGVTLITLDVELALPPLKVALRRAAGVLESLEVLWLAELLAQGRVLKLHSAGVRGVELPMILSSRQIGAIEPVVIDHIDGHRAAAAPAVAA